MEPLQAVEQFLKEHQVDGNQLLLACSGGVDSMVLLHLFQELGFKPALAHCNFLLRAKDSDEDEEFLRQYSQAHHLQFFTKKFDTSAFAEKRGISTQMAARELRYDFFEQLLVQHKLKHLAIAHHADDSVETILLNLGRGTGLSGLAGILHQAGKIIRPLHRCFRSEIVSYAYKNNLKWREDASNQKVDYQRNYIRHRVVPRYREAFPSFENSIQKSLAYLDEDRELFKHLVADQLDQLLKFENDTELLDIAKLTKSKHVKALLRHWLMPKSRFDLEAIYHSLSAESGAYFKAGNYELVRDRTHLILKPTGSPEPSEFLINETDSAIDQPISMQMEKLAVENFSLDPAKTAAALDFDQLQFPLKLRRWKNGDRFYPFGMKGAKKLSDYFVDRKYSLFDKQEAWLLCSGDDIVWIVNERIDNRYCITDKTKTVYFVRLK